MFLLIFAQVNFVRNFVTDNLGTENPTILRFREDDYLFFQIHDLLYLEVSN